MLVVLKQAWTLLWHKCFIQNWRRASLWHILSCLVLDVAVPVLLVYVYLANTLMQRAQFKDKPKIIDPTRMKESMDAMMSNMLLPVGFFMFCRKVLGQIVLEKDKGLIEYLKMNGMKEAAYNLSFILHESFINGALICLAIDVTVYKRQKPEAYTLQELLAFNVATILFLMGITALSLLISKAFSSPGFATQIGSMLYLLPIFLSLYLKVLEMKHSFSKTINSTASEHFSAFEDDRVMAKERRKQADLEAMINETKEEDLNIYPPKKHAAGDRPMDRVMDAVNKSQHSQDQKNQLVEDKQYVWEVIAQKSLVLFPHTPYCDLAANLFARPMDKVSTTALAELYGTQVADFIFLFMLLLLIENWRRCYKGLTGLCFGRKDKAKKAGKNAKPRN